MYIRAATRSSSIALLKVAGRGRLSPGTVARIIDALRDDVQLLAHTNAAIASSALSTWGIDPDEVRARRFKRRLARRSRDASHTRALRRIRFIDADGLTFCALNASAIGSTRTGGGLKRAGEELYLRLLSASLLASLFGEPSLERDEGRPLFPHARATRHCSHV